MTTKFAVILSLALFAAFVLSLAFAASADARGGGHGGNSSSHHSFSSPSLPASFGKASSLRFTAAYLPHSHASGIHPYSPRHK